MCRRLSGEERDRLGRGDKADSSCHKHSASKASVTALSTRPWLPLPYLALLLLTLTRASLQGRVHARNIEPSSLASRELVVLPQLLTNDHQERVVNRLGEVLNAGAGWSGSISRGADRDDGDRSTDTLRQKGNFVFSGVDRIEQERKPAAEDLIGGLLRKKLLNDSDRTLRVDLSNSASKHLRF